ncbi:pheophytinase, chloroplastic-like [Prunus avium]|uniref:Pheophytinase, chloroplastic-like n=1 Tax=Prunus avium TaxID=42229 RepID=A0A6P5TZ52_PRUAV|nr:pheophytinase, chloroplastic-like [Prunus avium]
MARSSSLLRRRGIAYCCCILFLPSYTVIRHLPWVLQSGANSDPRSIAEVLKQVYADHSTNVDKVFSRILETSEHPAAAASFASIMLAPQGQLSFRDALSRCHMNNVPICLMYGKEDPWVKPLWGLQVKQQVPEAPYYEISPAGHCPHDEVPEVSTHSLISTEPIE